MDDDLSVRGLVEDYERIGQHCHTPDGWIVRAGAEVRVQQQQVNDGLNAGLDTPRTLRGMGRNVVEE